MNRLLCGLLAAALALSSSALLADTFGSGASSFDIDFVTIGNPGKLPDAQGKGCQETDFDLVPDTLVLSKRGGLSTG